MKKILLILVILGLLIFSGLLYYGAFKKVEIEVKNYGKFYLVYKPHKGEYKNIRHVIEEVKGKLGEKKIPIQSAFGIFYDDPASKPKEELRSEGGCMVSQTDYENFKNTLPNEFNYKILEEQKYISTQFPFKNGMSVLVGVFKVYHKLKDYVQTNHYGFPYSIEIYDVSSLEGQDRKITYLIPFVQN